MNPIVAPSVLHSEFNNFDLFLIKLDSCSLMKGTAPKIRMLCFVLINSIILNLLCVWILTCSVYMYALCVSGAVNTPYSFIH